MLKNNAVFNTDDLKKMICLDLQLMVNSLSLMLDLHIQKQGKDGGLTAVDQDAKNTSLGWAITSNGVANADYYQAALGADILDNLNFTHLT